MEKEIARTWNLDAFEGLSRLYGRATCMMTNIILKFI